MRRRLAEVRRGRLVEERMAHITDFRRTHVRTARHHVRQTGDAEDLTAVSAVLLVLFAAECVFTSGTLLDVLIVLPPNLCVGLADLLQLHLKQTVRIFLGE